MDSALYREAIFELKYGTPKLRDEELQLESSCKLFDPGKQDMLITYPELSKYPEFTNLKNNKKLLFVWWFANKSSPLSKLENKGVDLRRKTYLALQKSGLAKTLEEPQAKKFLIGAFPPDVSSAISKMQSFSPSTRMRAKMMTERMLNKLEAITETRLPSDPDEQAKVVTTVAKISDTLPNLITQLESGFGVTGIETASGKKAQKLIDEVIDETN